MNLPIYDLHCDLLSYLTLMPNAHAEAVDEIGCALPHLQAGNVRYQVMAIWTATGTSSGAGLEAQVDAYLQLEKDFTKQVKIVRSRSDLDTAESAAKIGLGIAVENASGLCEEDEPLDKAFDRLEQLTEKAGRPVYITLTHHTENRFGGGNFTEIGLKEDGKALLRHISGKNIAIDFSHTSDQLAEDIFACIDSEGLEIPLLASHSNFREVWSHPRNLPDGIAAELARRGGIIGINFVRDFVDEKNADTLMKHIAHGMEVTGNRIAFGGDFFPPEALREYMADRFPVFHPEHEDASKYPKILAKASGVLDPFQLTQLAWKQAEAFIRLRLEP